MNCAETDVNRYQSELSFVSYKLLTPRLLTTGTSTTILKYNHYDKYHFYQLQILVPLLLPFQHHYEQDDNSNYHITTILEHICWNTCPSHLAGASFRAGTWVPSFLSTLVELLLNILPSIRCVRYSASGILLLCNEFNTMLRRSSVCMEESSLSCMHVCMYAMYVCMYGGGVP